MIFTLLYRTQSSKCCPILKLLQPSFFRFECDIESKFCCKNLKDFNVYSTQFLKIEKNVFEMNGVVESFQD